jgi:hypothetical protein
MERRLGHTGVVLGAFLLPLTEVVPSWKYIAPLSHAPVITKFRKSTERRKPYIWPGLGGGMAIKEAEHMCVKS